MSLEDVLLIGQPGNTQPSFHLEEILSRHSAVSQAVARTVHREIKIPGDLWPVVLVAYFTYAFNVYKALGLILADRHYEAGTVLLRQLWETSLNIHWIDRDPEIRSQDFCNYTLIEFRKILARRESGDLDIAKHFSAPSLKEFDQMAENHQAKYFTKTAKRKRPQKSFSLLNAQDRARQLGEPWQREYGLLYDLGSHHSHGGPGAVLRPLFLSDPQRREAAEIDATALLALQSIDLIVRDVHVWTRTLQLDRPTEVEVAAAAGGVSEDPPSA